MTSTSLTAVAPAGRRPAGTNAGAGFLPSTASVAMRTIRKYFRTPQLIVLGAAQSVVFLLIFRYVFGGAIEVAGQSYVNFLVPGFVTTAVVYTGMAAAAGVAEDVQQGFFDRLRSLPIPRLAILAGRCLADTLLMVWGLAVAVVFSFAVGYRLPGSVADGLAAFGLCALFGFAFAWLFIAIGLIAGNAQAAQGISLLVTPLVFVSSAYVPVSSMPGWLQAVGEIQPVTPMVDAVRSLAGGPGGAALFEHSTSYYVGLSLAWTAAMVVGFALLAGVRFARR